jgi:MSHA pilin protein MshA
MKKQKGFTLIELIIVIIILGLLAAFAIPKYIELNTKARKATLHELAGNLNSAKELVHAIAKADKAPGDDITDIVNIGVTLNYTTLYPDSTDTGITASLQDISGFTDTYDDNKVWVRYNKNGAANSDMCHVNYTQGNPPTVVVVDTDCS